MRPALLSRAAARAVRPVRRAATATTAPEPPPTDLRVTVADVEASAGRARLDAFLASRLPSESRARLAAAVKAGAVAVNGRGVDRAAAKVKAGDVVTVGELPPPVPLHASPEAIPLDIVYEDDALIVVNKAAGMVVHPAPGARGGTLVGALLHHVGVDGDALLTGGGGEEEEDEAEGGGDASRGGEEEGAPSSSYPVPAPLLAPSGVRPGVVHRLDRGTSGLLVVAKTAAAHAGLGAQFRARSVRRVYAALLSGVPSPPAGTVETNIERDPRDRTRMAAAAAGSGKGRLAVSGYRTVAPLAGGAASLVEWRLATGRTHQIRVHAAHVGHPILGDAVYRGTSAGGVARLAA